MLDFWNIKILKMGEYTVKGDTLAVGSGNGMLKVPAWSVAVYGNGKKILIDTGVHDAQWVNDNVEIFSMAEDEKMENALQKYLGWKMDEVDIVINTHLHYDHCGNNRKFINAEFFVQRKEWEVAHEPLPIHKTIYLAELFDKCAMNYLSWHFVDGEETVLPGIMVFPTPGHSAGHQSVLIATKEGVVCACGDVCNTMDNLRNDLPPGITTSNSDVLKSYREIRRRANYFIPGHEAGLKNLQSSGFPTI